MNTGYARKLATVLQISQTLSSALDTPPVGSWYGACRRRGCRVSGVE